MDEETRVHLRYRRGDQVLLAEMSPVATDQVNPDRGVLLQVLQETSVASSWTEALALGFRQTKEDAMRVLRFLHKLVTRQLSPKNLGGPLSIVYVAGSEASQGLPRLLMFLTADQRELSGPQLPADPRSGRRAYAVLDGRRCPRQAGR